MVYPISVHQKEESPPPYRGVSVGLPINKAKRDVPPGTLAEHLTGPGVRRGKEVLFLCPLHDDHNPSLRVSPEKGYWYCPVCCVGGDVVTLACLTWGYDHRDGRSAAEAAAMLLLEFGHELPQRPQSWFRKQERQRPIRDAIGRVRFEHLRSRLYREFFEPSVVAIEDEAERERGERLYWEATEPLARMMAREIAERRSA